MSIKFALMRMQQTEDYTPIFYYLRDKKNNPVITVCLIEYKGDFSRGIAVCSPKEPIDKAGGQDWAEERAYTGLMILKNAEKPLTPKQIKRGRPKIKYTRREEINRPDIIDLVSDIYELRESSDDCPLSLSVSPFWHKICTFPENELTTFERKLVEKIRKAEKEKSDRDSIEISRM